MSVNTFGKLSVILRYPLQHPEIRSAVVFYSHPRPWKVALRLLLFPSKLPERYMHTINASKNSCIYIPPVVQVTFQTLGKQDADTADYFLNVWKPVSRNSRLLIKRLETCKQKQQVTFQTLGKQDADTADYFLNVWKPVSRNSRLLIKRLETCKQKQQITV